MSCQKCRTKLLWPPGQQRARCGVCQHVLLAPVSKSAVATLDPTMPSTMTLNPVVWAVSSNFFLAPFCSCLCLRPMRTQGVAFCLNEWWWRVISSLFAFTIAFWIAYIPFGQSVALADPLFMVSAWEDLPQSSVYRLSDAAVCWSTCIPRYSYRSQDSKGNSISSWCDAAECGLFLHNEACLRNCNTSFFVEPPSYGSSCPTLDKLCPDQFIAHEADMFFTGTRAPYCPHDDEKFRYSHCKRGVSHPRTWACFAALLTIASTMIFSVGKAHFAWVFRSDEDCSFARVLRILLVDMLIPTGFIIVLICFAAVREDHLLKVCMRARLPACLLLYKHFLIRLILSLKLLPSTTTYYD
jgi:LSD1 subclass zinc finger protein